MSQSSAFHLLHPDIQRYLWAEQWESLRDVQELSIPVVLRGDRDVVIAASTASGKTEAAFLPALTNALERPTPSLIVYISPLKALINDQFGRLQRLCENLHIPVWPWHGDIGATSKQRLFKNPRGVLLITPESLEAMLCNRGTSAAGIFRFISFFVVDELHAFIGTERGKQLQSLLHRVELVVARRVPRIGLSATLGDMTSAARFLRDDGTAAIIDAPGAGNNLQLVVKGFEEPTPRDGKQETVHAAKAIADHMFATLAGSSNLIFPNSRREVERFTHLLNELSDQAHRPREFWPHHGSLSKEIRSDTEHALKQNERPATAVCTNTLELGIDIGAVKSVAQIGVAPSVASLRQRMGRSGRREGEDAILRAYVVEHTLDADADLRTRLRLDTIQAIAVIHLLIAKWFEPPSVSGAHLSTLVQQLLSCIAQYGGLQAAEAYRMLCGNDGPFKEVSSAAFIELLRHLGKEDVLIQDGSGLLLHGAVGDRIVNHYSFYAAFTSDEEFRIVAGGKTLGTLPVSQMLTVGQRILFGGRTWLVEEVDEPQKCIYVAASKGGTPPLFNGGGGRVHTRVRQTMRELFKGSIHPTYLDATARRFLDEGQSAFAKLELDERLLLEQGDQWLLLTWLGDDANEAIACLLNARAVSAQSVRLGVEIRRTAGTREEVVHILGGIAAASAPSTDALLANAKNMAIEKWDGLLSPSLLRLSYASSHLDLDEALSWLKLHFSANSCG